MLISVATDANAADAADAAAAAADAKDDDAAAAADDAAAAAAPRCDAGLLFKHASVPQVVSSVKAEYPPVGNYHFNKVVSALKFTSDEG